MGSDATTSAPVRTPEQLREHFEVERELADRLRHANKHERKTLYAGVYNELFQRVPHHSQLNRIKTPEAQQEMVEDQMQLIRRFLKPDMTTLEVGAGDCAVSIAMSETAKQVYAIDVSDEITKHMTLPDNVQLTLSDGSNIPVPAESTDIAYSNQLMEHLHPDDALEQLQGLCDALKPGGYYICLTPSRLTGPHDISKHFEKEACGFHLKEYTYGELAKLFKQVGFRKFYPFARLKGRYLRVPYWFMRMTEMVMGCIPFAVRRKLSNSFAVQGWFGPLLVAQK